VTTWTLHDYTPEEDEAWAMMEKEQQYEQERKQNMYWNNRIVKETVKYMHDGEEVTEYFYEISEVYYNDKDEPCGYCKSTAGGETFDEMREVYSRMAEAFKYDVLDAKTDFNHKFDDEEDDGKEKV
jgi:predicted alpha/beta superfamily hydrolase